MAAFNVSLAKVQIEVDRAWRDPILNSQYIAKTMALTEQLRRQTVRLPDTISGTGRNAKQITQTIFWPVSCTVDTAACADECLVATAEATDDQQDVVLTCLRQVGFKETMKRFRASPLEYARVLALQWLVHMKALDEYLTQQYIAFLEANKGDHEYQLSVGTDNAGDWEINASDWNVNLIPEFMLSAEISRFSTPYLLDGFNFATQLSVANAYQPNLDGKGVYNLFQQFPFVQDPVNMSAAAPNKTYMVNSSAVAFLTGNFWDTTPTEYAPGHRVWKVQSKNLPGVWYDVHEIQACTSNDFVTSYHFRVNGGFFLNPLGCDEDRTGILAFERIPGI